jgi:hypothetical protein
MNNIVLQETVQKNNKSWRERERERERRTKVGLRIESQRFDAGEVSTKTDFEDVLHALGVIDESGPLETHEHFADGGGIVVRVG